jgi:Xaa-Pro aminopeptidase
MWALSVLKFRDALPGARLALAGRALRTLRIRKTPAEVAALREAGAAIDRVHARVPGWLRPGLTERAVGSVITEAILAEGHATVDFVIVGSGPNAASPHHEVSDRVLAAGDVVVVDIGGTMPSGYCSTAPGPTPSASRRPSSARTTRSCTTPRRRPAPRSGPG